MTPMTTTELKRLWNELRAENPNLCIREAAEKLGVSEAELLATDVGSTVTRLDNKCAEMLQQLHRLKRVMALTRNDAIVHERKGEYDNMEI